VDAALNCLNLTAASMRRVNALTIARVVSSATRRAMVASSSRWTRVFDLMPIDVSIIARVANNAMQIVVAV